MIISNMNQILYKWQVDTFNIDTMEFTKKLIFKLCKFTFNERKSKQAHIPKTPALLDNAAQNEWQWHAWVMDNQLIDWLDHVLGRIVNTSAT